MHNIFSTLLSSLRGKFTMHWTKTKLLMSPIYWRTKGIGKLRNFFFKMFNVKPKDKMDYYILSKWMVSKRLAFAMVIALGFGCTYFLCIMQPVFGITRGNSSIRTYYYTSIPLKFKTGMVQIVAQDKHIAYVGNVDKGYAVGKGQLFDKQNALVYEGEFENSMFNGFGKRYYPNGLLEYEGQFVDNEYSGKGITYNESGVAVYDGNFINGQESGEGQLFNSTGSPVLKGNFVLGEFAFAEFLGKTAAQAAQMYTGTLGVYSTAWEYCVHMKEIDGVYSLTDNANALDGNGVINEIYVGKNTISLGGKEVSMINDLSAYFGEPVYYGNTWVTMPEAVIFNSREASVENTIGMVNMNLLETFDNVFTVNSYDGNFETYIYVYKKDGLLYTFYTAGGGESEFQTYAISLE